MRPNSYYDDDLNTPPPPSNWRVFGVILAFLIVFIAFAMLVTSCACTVTCRPDIPRAIEIIEAIK